tara:strand:+ start:1317 stop:2006 length:690 start_codon:yes stop_codon:yes gene_type:complete
MITVVIPTLNEAKNIPNVIRAFKDLNYSYEIIFVDDNSDDNTEIVIQNLINKKIKFIKRRKKKKDLSKSVMLGVQKASYNNILVIDCDLQHNVKNANSMIKIFLREKLDIVIGSRFLKKKYSGNLGLLRSIFSLIFIFLINFFFKKKSTDPLSGFFVCKKKIILNNKKNLYLRGYKILFDLLYNGKKNITILDFQINFKSRAYGKSKLNYKIVFIFIKQFLYSYLNKNK